VAFLVDPDVAARVDRLEIPFNRHGVDPYGVRKRELVWFFSFLAWHYRKYFRVTTSGLDNIPRQGRAILVGNHSGGIALDAGMTLAACMLELEPPRLAMGMIEHFLAAVPFAGTLLARAGQLGGLPETAERLLRDDRLLMVFPEGARGTAKLYWQRHSLVGFGGGFMRLALATGTPIIPFAFVGGGEAIPTIKNLYGLGKLLGAPYLPITPWLVPWPRPCALGLHFGEPVSFAGTGREEDNVISGHVGAVKERITALIAAGVAQRAGRALVARTAP
jgi:1-acyl-sn-glycerol-3-phosphate acyltransferase